MPSGNPAERDRATSRRPPPHDTRVSSTSRARSRCPSSSGVVPFPRQSSPGRCTPVRARPAGGQRPSVRSPARAAPARARPQSMLPLAGRAGRSGSRPAFAPDDGSVTASRGGGVDLVDAAVDVAAGIDQRGLDLVRRPVGVRLGDQRRDAGDDRRRHRGAADLQVAAVDDALRAERFEVAAGRQGRDDVRARRRDLRLREPVLGGADARPRRRSRRRRAASCPGRRPHRRITNGSFAGA